MRNFFQNHFDPLSEPKQVPQKGAALFLHTLWSNGIQLFALNLLTLLLCIPVVTAPAALCAMNRVCGILIRRGYVFLLGDYFKEFKQSFFRSALLGLLYGGFFLSGFISICYSIAFEGEPLAVFSKLFGFFEIGITFLLSGWSFILLSLQDLSLGQLFRSTFAMILLEPVCSLKILLITVSCAAGIWFLFPYSVFALLVLPCLSQFALCWITKVPVQKRIVDRAESI